MRVMLENWIVMSVVLENLPKWDKNASTPRQGEDSTGQGSSAVIGQSAKK